jgi:hypothetical protein
MDKDQLAATNEAIKKLGGLTKAADTFNCIPENVQHWRTRGVPNKHVKRVNELTKVSRKRLRPDLYE